MGDLILITGGVRCGKRRFAEQLARALSFEAEPFSGIPVAEGAIVGQWLKQDGLWWNPVDPRRVEALMSAVEKMRR